MKFEFKITIDVDSGEYTADCETVYTEEEKTKKVNLKEVSRKVSKMFVELSKEYSERLVSQNIEIEKTKEEKERMN